MTGHALPISPTLTRLHPLLGDTVVARVDLHRSEKLAPGQIIPEDGLIPATTLGIVVNRVLGNPELLLVDFGSYGLKYVYAKDIDVIESCELLTDFVQGFVPGAALADLLNNQMQVICTLQAHLEKKDLQIAQMKLTHQRECAKLAEALEQATARAEGAEAQAHGLAEQLQLAPARLAPLPHPYPTWTETPIGVDLGHYGWTFGGEKTDPETNTPTAWRWFRDGLVQGQ